MAEFLDQTPEDDDEGSLVGGNDNFVQLRNYAKKLEKEVKAKDKMLSEMESKIGDFERIARESSAKEAAREKGLSQEQIDMLFKLQPGADAEAVATFAEALGVQPKANEDEEAEETAPPAPSNFQPVTGGNAPAKPYSSEDVRAAVQRGDYAFLEKVAAEAARDPSRLALKHGDLIE